MLRDASQPNGILNDRVIIYKGRQSFLNSMQNFIPMDCRGYLGVTLILSHISLLTLVAQLFNHRNRPLPIAKANKVFSLRSFLINTGGKIQLMGFRCWRGYDSHFAIINMVRLLTTKKLINSLMWWWMGEAVAEFPCCIAAGPDSSSWTWTIIEVDLAFEGAQV